MLSCHFDNPLRKLLCQESFQIVRHQYQVEVGDNFLQLFQNPVALNFGNGVSILHVQTHQLLIVIRQEPRLNRSASLKV